MSGPSAVPLRLFRHHHSAGVKPLSVSPFCIPTADPNKKHGGDSTTPPAPAVQPHQSKLCHLILSGRAGVRLASWWKLLQRAAARNAAAPLTLIQRRKTSLRRQISYQGEDSETLWAVDKPISCSASCWNRKYCTYVWCRWAHVQKQLRQNLFLFLLVSHFEV